MASTCICICMHVVLFLSLLDLSLSQIDTSVTESVSTSGVTKQELDTSTTDVHNATDQGTIAAQRCHFESTDPNIRDKLSEALKTATKLIKFTIKFVNSSDGEFYPDDILNSNDGSVFRPNHWNRATNLQGRTLLMLDHNFEVLSLSLLKIGVESMDVNVVDKPEGCIIGLNSSEKVRALRHLLLNDFKVTESSDGGSLGDNEGICNQQCYTVNGKPSFVYQCCHIDPDGKIVCEDIHEGVWIMVLLMSIFIIKILVALYSPSFLPETYYRQKYTDVEYVHHFPEGKMKKKIRVVKTMNPEYYQSENPPVQMTNLKGLENLHTSVERMHTDEIQDLKLDRIHFTVEMKKLLAENYVPVSVIRMLNDNIFQCKIRNISALKPCCDTGICTALHHPWRVVTWFSCLKILAKLILIGILAIPWIIRLIVYYTYEADVVEDMKAAAKNLNVELPLSFNFTRYLTPVHPVYIVIYIVVSIVALVYGFMGRDLKTQLRLTLRTCLRQMRERSRTDVYAWAFKWLLAPLTKFGVFGILVIPFYWPFFLIIFIPVFAVSTFPALNLSMRLIAHPFSLMCQKCILSRLEVSEMPNITETFQRKKSGAEMLFKLKEDLTKKDICVQSCVIVASLVSFWSLTFLLMECLYFFVEVAVYTLMGIIVNAGATLRFVTLFFLLWVYAKDSLLGVHKLYLSYHSIIRSQVISNKQEEMVKVAKQNDFFQEDTAFRVQSSFNAADVSSGVELEVKDGVLFWKTSGLLVFLDQKDKPFTPLKFFFETVDMDCCGVPGPVWRNTLLAFRSLMKMAVFLFFVVAVVLAFGNQFSSTNQTLAILAGGFLPFALKNFLMRGSGGCSVNTSSVRFVTEFDKLVAAYSQMWPVADIIPEQESPKRRSTTSPKRTSSKAEMVSDRTTPDGGVGERGDANDLGLDIDCEVELVDLKVDLIVHVSSAEKMRHLVKSCVNVDVESANPAPIRTSASFSNPMYSHT